MRRRQLSTAELTQSQFKRKVHPIVALLEEHGYEEKPIRQGSSREMTKGEARVLLRFYDRLFLSAYVHESDERNLGRFDETQLRSYLAGSSCLKEHLEPWGQLRHCKGDKGHPGACGDSEGAFPIEEAS